MRRWCITGSGKYLPKKPLLQYGTFRTKEEAEQFWNKFCEAFPHIKEYEDTIEEWDVEQEIL